MATRKNVKIKKKKLMTAKEVQQEFLTADIRKIRLLLNQYCHYRKIGKTYYYLRTEVERLLCDSTESYEFELDDEV